MRLLAWIMYKAQRWLGKSHCALCRKVLDGNFSIIPTQAHGYVICCMACQVRVNSRAAT